MQVTERHGYRTATDLDVLAVRLPHAAELVPGRHAHARDVLLSQDARLDIDPDHTDILIAEVKRGRAKINEGYHDPEVLRFALRRTGCCPPEMIDVHTSTLARVGSLATRTADGHRCRIRIATFAGESTPLAGGILNLGLAHCLAFIRERLAAYDAQLRGAYFRDPVINLLGRIDALTPDIANEKELIHAT